MTSVKHLTSTFVAVFIAALTLAGSITEAFSIRTVQSHTAYPNTSTGATTALFQFGRKKDDEEDLSFIESRDLTREEMLEINRQNEKVMNRELQAMTGISVLFSIPIFYLCW